VRQEEARSKEKYVGVSSKKEGMRRRLGKPPAASAASVT